MGKPKLSKGAGKRARSSSEEEERSPAQQSIKSYFSKNTCQLWTTVGQESKGNGKRKSLKLSTKKDNSKIKNASTNSVVQKKNAKVNLNTASKNDKTNTVLPSAKGNTELQHFTKIVEQQNATLASLPTDEKKNGAKNSPLTSKHSHSPFAGNNSKVIGFKPPSQACSKEKKKNSFTNGYTCNGVANGNEVTVTEDDDFIPPTPSPVAQHSFINCRFQKSASSASKVTNAKVNDHLISATNYYNSEQREKSVVKTDGTALTRHDLTMTDDGEESLAPDLNLTSDISLETQSTTCTTTRKKYKLSRKGKPPKVLSSPLKGRNVHVSPRTSPKNQKHVTKATDVMDHKESSSVIAPSKCVVLRSRMKRSATKGSSPLQKRLQTEVSLPEKNVVKCNLWDRMEETIENSNSAEPLDQQVIDSKQHILKDNHAEDKSMLEEYMLDTSFDNSLLNEELMECLESSVKGNLQPNHKEMITDQNIEKSHDIIEQFKSPVKSTINKSPGLKKLSVQTQTPSKGALANTSMDSLVDAAELDSLLDGVEWSPMVSQCPDNVHSASKSSSCKALFSPVKRPEQANQISKDLRNKCTLNNNNHLSPLGAAGYSRFLVLEVSRRELTGGETVAKYGRHLSEKMLRLFEETLSQEKFCSLREEWGMSQVEPGDIVHITGTFDTETGMCILDNSTDCYLVVHPDTLVSGTTVSMATKCLRQSILNERFRTEGQSEAMLIGTLLHDLFDLAMEFNEFSPDALLKRASALLQKLSYLDDFYSLGQTENWAMEKLKEHIPLLCDWAKKFVTPFPHPDFGAMDFKTPEYPQSTEQPSVCVSALKDIEENIWSPRFGLKGKVDATVEVKIDRRPKIRRHRPDKGNQVQTKVLPLELKTGKMFTKLGSIEHRAQVILYTLLMSDRYSQAIDAGLLFYMKSSHMLSVPGFIHEKRALVMKRNEVARYLTLNRAGATGTMPAMLKDLNTCKRCSQAQNCTTFHKATEQGDGKTSGLGAFFDENTDHMSKTYVNYFTNWYKLVCLEGKQMEEKRNQKEIWCLDGWEREKLGRCFSSMVLMPHDHDPAVVNTRYFRHKFARCADHPSVSPLQDVPITVGERIILSEDNNGAVAVAAGYIHEVKKTEVLVLLDRDLTKRYAVQTEETSSKLYRLDKDEEYSTLTTLWSNMAKLFKGDSDRDAQLRRQIVDLEPPVFSRKRRNDTVSMSSQTSEITEFFTQQTQSQTSKSQKTLSDPAVESILQELNTGQRKAVSKALGAHHYALILGMPGTGKTTTISCLVRVLVASGKSVLLTSYTHTAVDNILLKLKEANLDFIRLGQAHKILPELQSYSAQKAAEGIKTVSELRRLYESKSVVATTCLGVNHALFSQRSFDYCIVDEASQITQPVCIGPLRHARVFILVGDHYQLPPLVQSVEAREGGMDISLFKRLSERHPHAVISLEHQYRMNQDIMELSNTLIYEHRLKCGTQGVARAVLELPDWDELISYVRKNTGDHTDNWLLDALAPSRPVVFLDTDGVPAPETRSEHLVSNETEALLVHQLACALLKAGLQPSSLGIISPYRHQLKLITQVFHSSKQNEIEINTVDKYQGRDKACIIVSLVRSNEHSNVGDLLRDWRRVNVAVTRAKRKLILIGSLVTLKGSLLLQELFDLLERKDWVQVLPHDAHKRYEFVAKSSQTSPGKSLTSQRSRLKY